MRRWAGFQCSQRELYNECSRCQHESVPPSKKTAYHHGDLAQALVVAARDMVVAEGWEAVSLRGVARTVGVSANATYRHFPDKAALLLAVARQAFDDLALRMRRVQARAKGTGKAAAIARFEATGQAYFGFAVDHPELFRLMFSPVGRGHAEGRTDDNPSPFAILGEALDGLVAAGVITETGREGAELLSWTAIHGLATLALSEVVTTSKARTQALSVVLRFVIGGLQSRG